MEIFEMKCGLDRGKEARTGEPMAGRYVL